MPMSAARVSCSACFFMVGISPLSYIYEKKKRIKAEANGGINPSLVHSRVSRSSEIVDFAQRLALFLGKMSRIPLYDSESGVDVAGQCLHPSSE